MSGWPLGTAYKSRRMRVLRGQTLEEAVLMITRRSTCRSMTTLLPALRRAHFRRRRCRARPSAAARHAHVGVAGPVARRLHEKVLPHVGPAPRVVVRHTPVLARTALGKEGDGRRTDISAQARRCVGSILKADTKSRAPNMCLPCFPQLRSEMGHAYRRQFWASVKGR